MFKYIFGALVLLLSSFGIATAPQPKSSATGWQQLSGDPPGCPYPTACKP